MSKFKGSDSLEKKEEGFEGSVQKNPDDLHQDFNKNYYESKQLVEIHGPRYEEEFSKRIGGRRQLHALPDRFELSWSEHGHIYRFVMAVYYDQSNAGFRDEVRRAWSRFEKK